MKHLFRARMAPNNLPADWRPAAEAHDVSVREPEVSKVAFDRTADGVGVDDATYDHDVNSRPKPPTVGTLKVRTATNKSFFGLPGITVCGIYPWLMGWFSTIVTVLLMLWQRLRTGLCGLQTHSLCLIKKLLLLLKSLMLSLSTCVSAWFRSRSMENSP